MHQLYVNYEKKINLSEMNVTNSFVNKKIFDYREVLTIMRFFVRNIENN